MMSIGSPATSGGKYYEQKDNYYFLGGLENQWFGEGAKALGLEGAVDRKTFDNILQGELPNGVSLGRKGNDEKAGHRDGYDFTFSAPKSVSLMVLVAGDRQLLEAHNRAVNTAMQTLETLASARITENKQTEIVKTGNLVAAIYVHDTSRNHDPQLHSHAVTANLTQVGEDKWRALSSDKVGKGGFSEQVFQYQITLGRVYRNALEREATALGYQTEQVGPHGMWELKGVPAEVREALSSRSKEIAESVGDNASAKSKDVAALDTRRAKSEQDRDLLLTEWKQKISEQGFDIDGFYRKVSRQRPEIKTPSAPLPQEPERPSFDPDKLMVTPERPADKAPPLPAGPAVVEPQPQQPGEERSSPIPSQPVHQPGGEPRREEPRPTASHEAKAPVEPGVSALVKEAVSILSDRTARFNYADVLLTSSEIAGGQYALPALKSGIEQAIGDGLLIPMDKEKSTFTSQIHVLDELSIQSMARELQGRKNNLALRSATLSPELASLQKEAIQIYQLPAGTKAQREAISELTDSAQKIGRSVTVLGSSLSRVNDLKKDRTLAPRTLNKTALEKDFFLPANSTLVVEGAEKLSLKEATVLLGHAVSRNAQVVFLDGQGKGGLGSALGVLEEQGIARASLRAHQPAIETRVISLQDKKDRLSAVAERYAELTKEGKPVVSTANTKLDQRYLTGAIRDTLKGAGVLGQKEIVVEARIPVFMKEKERSLVGNYRTGMVLEHQVSSSFKAPRKTYRIDAVHQDKKMITVIGDDGQRQTMKLSSLDKTWQLFESKALPLAEGEKLKVTSGSMSKGSFWQASQLLKSKSEAQVLSVSDHKIEIRVDGRKMAIDPSKPVYMDHAYVYNPAALARENGHVLATVGQGDLNANNVNQLAMLGSRLEIYTGEKQDKAEQKLTRLQNNKSPIQVITALSPTPGSALDKAQDVLLNDVQKAVNFAIEQASGEKGVLLSDISLREKAMDFLPLASGSTNPMADINKEIDARIKSGELIKVMVGGDTRYVSRAVYEMEKTILKCIEDGKGTQLPLMPVVDAKFTEGLKDGQAEAVIAYLTSPDQFIAVQGFAGVGKTTMLRSLNTAVSSLPEGRPDPAAGSETPEQDKMASLQRVALAISSLPEGQRPEIIGLGPTHRSVEEMRAVGIEAQTLKSWLVETSKQLANGDKLDFSNKMFVLDESSMLGTSDLAEASQLIGHGNARKVMLTGDKAQFLPVEGGGSSFSLAQERSAIRVVAMREIVRQTNKELTKAIYSLAAGDVSSALRYINHTAPSTVAREGSGFVPQQSIVDVKALQEIEKQKPEAEQRQLDVIQMIAADYVGREKTVRENTLIVANLNKDVDAINRAVHESLKEEKKLGAAITVPVLRPVPTKTRELSQIKTYQVGQVIVSNDKHYDITAVNQISGAILTKDEMGKTKMFTPFEHGNKDMALFERDQLELAVGDKIRMRKTVKDEGHLANQAYTVVGIQGDQVLLQDKENPEAIKRLDPRMLTNDQHIDYAYARTGHGVQGAGETYAIYLGGAQEGRGIMATLRAFYVGASRAKEHVQMYLDDLQAWQKAVIENKENTDTAHDVLAPEQERKQARAIYKNGVAIKNSPIGKKLLAQEGIDASGLVGKVLKPTKRHADPQLAIQVLDNNGKVGGLGLAPLKPERSGSIGIGTFRLVAADKAEWGVLRKSKNGEVKIVTSLSEGLAMAKNEPESGVLLQMGDKPGQPSQAVYQVIGAKDVQEPDLQKLQAKELESKRQEQERMAAVAQAAKQAEEKTLRQQQEKEKAALDAVLARQPSGNIELSPALLQQIAAMSVKPEPAPAPSVQLLERVAQQAAQQPEIQLPAGLAAQLKERLIVGEQPPAVDVKQVAARIDQQQDAEAARLAALTKGVAQELKGPTPEPNPLDKVARQLGQDMAQAQRDSVARVVAKEMGIETDVKIKEKIPQKTK